MVIGITDRAHNPRWWVLGLSGLASIIFGIVLFLFPGAGALALVWVIGAYAILFGALLVYLSFKLRNVEETAVLGNA